MLKKFFQLIEKIIRVIFGVILIKKISSYLGPADFGNLNFIENFLTLLIGISVFGMDVILTKNFLSQKHNDHKEKVFVNGFVLIFFISLLSILFSTILIYYFFNFKYNNLLILVLSSVIFNCLNVSEFHLIAINKIRFISIIRTTLFTIISLLKLTIVYLGLSFKYFAFIIVFETIIFSILIYCFNYIMVKLFI